MNERKYDEMYWELLDRYVALKDEYDQLELTFSKVLTHKIKEFQLEKNVTPKNRVIGKVEPE